MLDNCPMEIQGINKWNAMLVNQGALFYLQINYKMDICIVESTHCKYNCSRPCMFTFVNKLHFSSM